ncbi:Hypothetical predicted protein [Olea europaea subsp. europaea]|uniref:Uncharacterized protein n=1 Tax=Olea europaea subsp. europaea TaxID=158383 RepID=A0A8S0PDP7_OLEEU|nr:Hypothetical predicted protein [Olea europaea subsp. europaea]
MASDNTSAKIQQKLRGNYGKEDNAEMMKATYLEQLPVQNDSEIANQKEVIKDGIGISDNLLMNTPADLQLVYELTKSSSKNQAAILENKKCNVTPEMNNELVKPFTATEVFQALKEMHPTKAPGPDGSLLFFIKNFGRISVPLLQMLYYIP